MKSNLKAGYELGYGDFEFRSPGQGIQPDKANELVGQVLRKDIKKGEMLFYSHFVVQQRGEDRSSLPEFSRPFGIPVRFHDVETLVGNTDLRFVEFHLTNRDLSFDLSTLNIPSTVTQVAVHSPELFDEDFLLDLANETDEIRDASISYLRKVVSVATNLGDFLEQPIVPIVVNVGGQTTDGFVDSESKLKGYRRVAEGLKLAQTDRVNFLIQTMPPFPWHFGGQSFHNLFVDPFETRDFCQGHGFDVCFDVAHSAMAAHFLDLDIMTWIDTLDRFVKHLHISDALGLDGEGLQIGKGEIDFVRLCKRINELDQQTSFIPEIWQGHIDQGAESFSALKKLAEKGLC